MAIFRFRIRSRDARPELLATQKAAAAWLRRLPRADAIERHETVTRAIENAFRSAGELRFEQVGAIEFLDAELATDRGRFITQYVEHADGAPALANRMWQAAYDSCQGFIVAYRSLLDRAANEPRWTRALPRLAARLIHFYGIDAKLRVLKSEAWIPAKWMDLHRIYKRAIDLRVEHAPTSADPSGSGALRPTVEQEYVAVLLTHLFSTGTLALREIDWAAAALRTWATGLRLDDVSRTPGGFVVDVGGRRGLQRRRENESGVMLRYLDTGPLTERIDRAVAELRRSVAPDEEGAGPDRAQRIVILERLRPVVSPDPRSAVAREPRAEVGLPVQVRVGLSRICQELAPGHMHHSPAELAAGAEPPASAADELERLHRPIAAFPSAPPAGERLWQMADRSATGTRIVASAALGQNAALGMLVAMRDPGEGTWLLGVVRRVVRPTPERIEAGVAIIASGPIAVALHAKRQAREEMGFVVDGVDVSTVGKRFDGLYLPSASRTDRGTAKTLVIPSSEYTDGRQIILITSRTVYTVALRAPLERHPGWTWVAIDIVAQTVRD